MSAEQLHVGDEIDPIMNDLRARHDEIARRVVRWIEMKDALLPLVHELILLGCELSMSSNYDDDLYIRFTGDKQKFLAVVRAQFRHGLKPDLKSLAKGATEGSWFAHHGALRIWTSFSSTVCRRIQIGTQMQEVPIYETRCEAMVPDSAELPEMQPESQYQVHDIPF